jgi:hypothetical protein
MHVSTRRYPINKTVNSLYPITNAWLAKMKIRGFFWEKMVFFTRLQAPGDLLHYVELVLQGVVCGVLVGEQLSPLMLPGVAWNVNLLF